MSKRVNGTKGKSNRCSAPKSFMKKGMTEESFYNDGASAMFNGSNVSPSKKGNRDDSKPMDDCDDDMSVGNGFGTEMMKLLEGFSSKMNETLEAKRQKVRKFAEESTNATVKKLVETCKTQSVERRAVLEEFRKQMVNMMDNIEVNLKEEKEFCEKSQKVMAAQQKQLSLGVAYRNQQAQKMKEMTAEFFKGIDNLEASHTQQCAQIHNDMTKQMAKLRKKILQEDRQMQMMQVRKNLQSMLFN